MVDDSFFAQALIDALDEALIATDERGTVMAWNRNAEELYGWKSEEAIGQNIRDLTVPETGQEAAQSIMEGLAEGRPWSGDFLVRRRDGSTFLAHVRNAPIRGKGGFVGVLGLSHD